MAGATIRILLADDHPVVRQGLRVFLGSQPGFEVVGEATNGAEAVDLARSLDHDIVLMDLVMPGIDGVEATRRILAESPPARVLVLTSFGTDDRLFPALDAGALGFVLKESTAEELLQAIRQVAQGLSSLSPSIARRLIGKVAHYTGRGAPDEPLTPRENEILRAMAGGLSNAAIAGKLCISRTTVRTHVTHVLAKLGVTSRTQAALYALRHRIATLDDA